MEIKLTVNRTADLPARQACRERLESLFGDHIIGEGDTLLAERVLQLLRERGQTLATAESCTGGLIASMLTRIPGSSEAFHAGFVTYANHIKASVLGVSRGDLERHGAVSEPVVRQMATGAMNRSGADYAVAVSGIAGPDGGTPEKPVGTVWLAWGDREMIHSRCLCWPVERSLFQIMIAAGALDAVRRLLLGIELEPRYFAQRRAG
jgi:nicotinamide-nucleotide amidase